MPKLTWLVASAPHQEFLRRNHLRRHRRELVGGRRRRQSVSRARALPASAADPGGHFRPRKCGMVQSANLDELDERRWRQTELQFEPDETSV
jgi:hypothetical protein